MQDKICNFNIMNNIKNQIQEGNINNALRECLGTFNLYYRKNKSLLKNNNSLKEQISNLQTTNTILKQDISNLQTTNTRLKQQISNLQITNI